MALKTESNIPFDQVRAWLFDLDGTLMDTDDQSVETLARWLGFLGAARARRLARRAVMFGEMPLNAAATALDTLGLDALAFAVGKRLHGNTRYDFRIIAGVKPLLTTLARHFPLAVVSTRSAEASRAFLAQYDLTRLFTAVVTRESTPRLKPHPAPVRFAAQALGVPVETCVMVGDTPPDIRAARRAGAWAVGVLCGFGEEEELRLAGAHLVLPSTADLLPLLSSFLTPHS